MKNELRELEAELRRKTEKIFEEKKRKLGVEAVLDLSFIDKVPIEEVYVYAEAFPFETPPRVWMEIVRVWDVTTREITESICEELIHIKHPQIEEESEELKRKIQECMIKN